MKTTNTPNQKTSLFHKVNSSYQSGASTIDFAKGKKMLAQKRKALLKSSKEPMYITIFKAIVLFALMGGLMYYFTKK